MYVPCLRARHGAPELKGGISSSSSRGSESSSGLFLRGLLWESNTGVLSSAAAAAERKLLAGVAILLGTTAVTAMLALATTIGDRIHRELAVYGANIVVYPKAEQLQVKVGGVDVKPATGGAYLKESDLEKLHGIFWANNITGVSPELRTFVNMVIVLASLANQARWVASTELPDRSAPVDLVGYWFDHPFGTIKTGAPVLHPWWKLAGRWPSEHGARFITPTQ